MIRNLLARWRARPKGPDLTDVEWPGDWQVPTNRQAAEFRRELLRELPRGHRLSGLPLSVLAHRPGADDLLLAVDHPDFPLAEVHLTWSRESDPAWPACRTFVDFDAWRAEQEA